MEEEKRDGIRIVYAVLVAAGIPDIFRELREKDVSSPEVVCLPPRRSSKSFVMRNALYWEEESQD